MRLRKSRELLLRYYHDPQFRFGEVTVCYVNRGAPGDESCAEGAKIRALDSFYMEIEGERGTSPIPYHRITRILYQDEPVWERGRKTGGESAGD